MGGNFKFQVQDSFSEYFFFEIWKSKKQIALSEKKPPLVFMYLIYPFNLSTDVNVNIFFWLEVM